MRPSSPVLILLTLLAAAAGAQPAFLVRDLQTLTVNDSSSPLAVVAWRGRAYFVASDHFRGYELWTTDGTRQGTASVRDASPGAASSWTHFSNAGPLSAGESRLWMTLDDGVAGEELWVSDGTAAGTRLVRDLCPGACGTELYDRPFAGDHAAFFSVRDEALGSELWTSDGTRGGTRLLKDICAGPCDSAPVGVARLGGVVLFEASDEEHGRELWRSDGSAAGTALVKDLCPGSCDSLGSLTWAVLGDEAFFGRGTELWKTDGTPEGTARVKDLCPPPCNDGFLRPYTVGDSVMVVARSGRDLWKSDGTPEGTSLVAALPQELYVESAPFALARNAGPQVALFVVIRLGAGDAEIWRTDGTGASTFKVAGVGQPSPLAAVAGKRLIFAAASTPGNFEPWASDGTPEGTRQLKEIRGGKRGSLPEGFTSLGPSQVVFTAFNGRGVEPWITDGTPAGTRLLKDVNRRDASANPGELTAFAGRLFFAADSDDEGRSLWTSDGTAAGTAIVAAGLEPREITAGADRLFFTGSDAEDGVRHLWTSDGTPEGTERLSPSPPLDGFAYELVTVGGTLFFAEGGEYRGQRLWRSDGTPAGTVIVKDLEPDWQTGCGSGTLGPPEPCGEDVDYPRGLTPVGGTLFLVGNDFEHGAELWKSDGTGAGTERVADLEPGENGSEPRELTAAGDRLVFTASTGGVRRLWSTDGTEAGTVAVDAGAAGEPRDLAAAGATLYFVAALGEAGDALFACAGDCGEATLVAHLEVGGFAGYASRLEAVDERLFFAVFSEATGQELWTSDGTAAGTGPVTEIAPGSHGAYPQSLAAIDGRLFFAADDGKSGLELWQSDGTAAGTCRVQDLARGRTPASPGDFVAAGDLIFFAAADVKAGRELWALPRTVLCPP